MTYTICEPCIDVKDRACVDECPVDCIYEGARMLYIHPDECVDCGACEPVGAVAGTGRPFPSGVGSAPGTDHSLGSSCTGQRLRECDASLSISAMAAGSSDPGRDSTTPAATASLQTRSPSSVRMIVSVHPSLWPSPPKEMSACSAAKSGQCRHPGLVNRCACFSEYWISSPSFV